MAELNARIIAKASGTSGEAPQPLDLQTAELAVNTADGKLFTKHTDGTIKEVGGSSDVGSINDLSDVQFDVTSTALFYRKGNADNPGEYDQRAGNKAYLYLNQYDASGVNINDILSSGSYDVYVSSDQGQVWVINAGSGVGGNTSVQLDEGARWRLLSTGGGNSWVPGNNDEELSGDIVVSTAADASVTIQPPSDGEILQWDSASQTFRPVSLPSAPVTSVNDETGVVSLGIQDMDDFSLYFDTNTYIFEFDEHSTASYYPYCRPGVIWHSEYYSDRVYFKSDKDGFAANDSANAAIAANGGNAAGVPFWIKQGDNAEWQYRKGVVGTNAGNCSAISITNIGSYGTPSLPITGAIPTYLTFADPVNEPYIPLQDEQVLRWDSTTSEWRPEDLAVVAKTGSYDDLTDLPTIPAAAPVDSVNGATGAVSLGIQDMDDFSLLADDGLGIGTYNVFVGDATNLYNTPGGAGIDFGNRTLPLGYQPGFSQLDADGVDRRAEFETINEGPVWVSINGLPFIQAVGNWETIFNGYLGVDLDGSGAAPDGTVINEVKVTTVEPGIPQPLEDGDYLRWNASSQLFSPAQLPSTSGAVDSVNGETGVVSLGVQDMNDFELVYAPASETWSTPNTGVPGAEQFRLYGAGAARLSTTTANGYRKDELLSYLITGANLEIIVNSVTHTATVTSPAPDLNGAGGPSEYIGVSFNVSPVLTDTDLADSSLVINFLDVGAVDTPLAEGDILQWVDAEQKFKPAQLPTGGGGAVDSVNGETGVVSFDRVTGGFFGTGNSVGPETWTSGSLFSWHAFGDEPDSNQAYNPAATQGQLDALSEAELASWNQRFGNSDMRQLMANNGIPTGDGATSGSPGPWAFIQPDGISIGMQPDLPIALPYFHHSWRVRLEASSLNWTADQLDFDWKLKDSQGNTVFFLYCRDYGPGLSTPFYVSLTDADGEELAHNGSYQQMGGHFTFANDTVTFTASDTDAQYTVRSFTKQLAIPVADIKSMEFRCGKLQSNWTGGNGVARVYSYIDPF